MQFFHDTQRNLLIYERPSPLLAQHIPEAKAINGSMLAFPFTLRNVQVCRWLNHPVPAIITDANYDWPIEPGKKALPHQKIMANFQVMHPKCFNLSDPGTMKTQPALWMADWLMQQFPPGECRVLIVGLVNILETVWASAIFKTFMGRRTMELLRGPAEKRRALLAKKPDFAIINYDGVGIGAHTRKKFELDGFSKDLAEDRGIRIVIIDEADAYADASTKRHRIARLVFRQRPYLTLLTGTPTSQSPTDAYGLAKLVNNAFGRSFTRFREETMFKVGNTTWGWKPRKEGYEIARRILVPAVRFDIREVWQDAPAMTTQQRAIELTVEQQKLMADLKRDLQITMRNGHAITAANEAVARLKYIQISLGGVYDGAHKSHAIDASPRYEEVERIIAHTPRKVLVFCPLTNIVHLLYTKLSNKWKCGYINGEVNPNERPKIIREFETDENFKVIILDAQSAAHGLNQLVVADTVIWMAPVDKTRLYIQGNARAHRPGQKWPVTVHQLVANNLEKEMFRRLETNTSMQGALLDAVRKGDL